MSRPSYRAAIYWLANNDDTEWLDEDGGASISACLVADLFGKPTTDVARDVRRLVAKQRKEQR